MCVCVCVRAILCLHAHAVELVTHGEDDCVTEGTVVTVTLVCGEQLRDTTTVCRAKLKMWLYTDSYRSLASLYLALSHLLHAFVCICAYIRCLRPPNLSLMVVLPPST